MLLLIIPPRFDPSIALSERAEIIARTYVEGWISGSIGWYDDSKNKYRDCLKTLTSDAPIKREMVDDFGRDKEKMWDFPDCAGEYATIVKDRTEKMFPVSVLKDMCNEAQGNPSGHLIFCDISFWKKQLYYLIFLIHFKYRRGLFYNQNKKNSSTFSSNKWGL